MNNENENESKKENDEVIECRPSNNELILQCATDIIFKAGFTPESLLAINSMQKNMFRRNMAVDDIADISGSSVEEVKEILKNAAVLH